MRPVARIAQSVEQGIENPRVLGSIPSPGTIIQKRLSISQDEKVTGSKVSPDTQLPTVWLEGFNQQYHYSVVVKRLLKGPHVLACGFFRVRFLQTS